ncbi:ABC transporter permease subunit, partial [Marivivens sp.]|uniref:ABC transporter permease subunit n=1 Tax=Marivivens sp. TaxID=1978374 RepID=UPI0025B93EA6
RYLWIASVLQRDGLALNGNNNLLASGYIDFAKSGICFRIDLDDVQLPDQQRFITLSFGFGDRALQGAMMSYILMYYVAVQLGWAPSVAMLNDRMSMLDKLHAISLPIAVLVMVVLAHMMRMTRAALLNVMQSAYIETAELKGIRRSSVIWRHAFPNSIAPIVNVVMLNMAYLVVGVVVVEVVFVYPGMGQYLVDHVAKRDVPVVQACGLIFAAVYIFLNMFADIVSILANPRLRHPK